MRPLLVALVLALLSGVGACGDVPPANYPTVAPAEDLSSELGVGDVVDVTIFNGTKESKASYTLNDSGTISVHYIGEVPAVGRTPDALRDEVRARLADGYLRDPIVAIRVTEVNSRKLSVSGQVNKPGSLRFTPGMTIIDVIAQSGDFTPMAKKNAVQVIRMVGDREESYTIPVEAIRENKRPNFPMASGDRVFIPERFI